MSLLHRPCHPSPARASISPAISPISRLTNELLVMVFLEGCCSLEENTRPFNITVACVNRRWRENAISFPALWTNIRIVLNHPLHLITLAFQRSNQNLNVFLDFWCPHPGTEPFDQRDVLDTILAHSERWQHLVVKSNDEDCLIDVIRRFSQCQFPHLRYFRVSLEGEYYLQHPTHTIWGGDAGILSLTHLRMEGIPVIYPSPLFVKHLRVGPLRDNILMSIRTLHALVVSLASVTHLVFQGCVVDIFDQQIIDPVPLDTLCHLMIDGNEACYPCGSASSIFQIMSAPNLESLAFVNLSGIDLERVLALVQARADEFLALKSLEFWDSDTVGHVSEAIIVSLPAITHLLLVRTFPGEFLRLLASSKDGNLWPHLHTLTIGFFDEKFARRSFWDAEASSSEIPFDREDTIDYLCKVITVRQMAGIPLQKLQLSPDLYSIGRVDWLRQRVQVEPFSQQQPDWDEHWRS